MSIAVICGTAFTLQDIFGEAIIPGTNQLQRTFEGWIF